MLSAGGGTTSLLPWDQRTSHQSNPDQGLSALPVQRGEGSLVSRQFLKHLDCMAARAKQAAIPTWGDVPPGSRVPRGPRQGVQSDAGLARAEAGVQGSARETERASPKQEGPAPGCPRGEEDRTELLCELAPPVPTGAGPGFIILKNLFSIRVEENARCQGRHCQSQGMFPSRTAWV